MAEQPQDQTRAMDAATEKQVEIANLSSKIYEELRGIAAGMMSRERASHTLQTTALVNEAYLRMVKSKNLAKVSRAYFFAAAATVMRRILVEHARAKMADMRGGGRERVTLSGVDVPDNDNTLDIVDLDEALSRLAALSQRAAQVVELRFFGGMTVEETAEALEVSPRTVNDDWTFARAWLRRELKHHDETR